MATWLLIIFALELALSKYSGDLPGVRVERELRVLAAVFQFSLIVAGYLYLLARQVLVGRLFSVERKARPAFLLLVMWTVVAGVATLEGLWFGNDPNYTLGDFYKFVLLPLLFGLAYFGLRTRREIDWVLKGLAIVIGVFLLRDFLQMLGWLREGYRFTASSTYHLATMIPLLIYLLFRRQATPGFRLLMVFVAVEAVVAVVLLQGLADYVFLLCGLLLFLLFWRKTKLALATTLVALVVAASVSGAFSVFDHRESYAKRKLEASSYARSALEFVESMGGSRAAEMGSVFRSYWAAPARIPLGFGMGSYLYVEPLSRLWAHWRGWDHFIHSALFESFYRAGLIGLVVLVAFLGHVFVRGRQLSRGPHREYGVFVMGNAVYQGANLAILSPLTFPWLILSISLAGTYVWEREDVNAALKGS